MKLAKSDPRCSVCGNPVLKDFEPCRRCAKEMFFSVGECCSTCGIDLAGADDPCPSCRDHVQDRHLDGIRALGPWSGPLRIWMGQFKYGGDIRMGKYPAKISAGFLLAWKPGATVIPVPPRPGKLFSQGFDCVSTLAGLIKEEGLEINRVLKRKGRIQQKSLSRTERTAGAHLKFYCKKRGRRAPKECVVLDDVSTTGTTLEECARALKELGAKRVYGFVLCKD